MTDVDYLLELYMAIKRKMLHNRFLKVSATPKFVVGIKRAADIVEKLHADPLDFLEFMIGFYAPMRIFPQPGHLTSKVAIFKYKLHQARNNIYRYPTFSTDKDKCLIHETMETVFFTDIVSPVTQDSRLRYTLAMLKEGEYKGKISYNDIIYSLLKLELLHKPIPEELVKAKEEYYGVHSL